MFVWQQDLHAIYRQELHMSLTNRATHRRFAQYTMARRPLCYHGEFGCSWSGSSSNGSWLTTKNTSVPYLCYCGGSRHDKITNNLTHENHIARKIHNSSAATPVRKLHRGSQISNVVFYIPDSMPTASLWCVK